MTIEERFARIEHYTAGMAEERRKDREEARQLWRETQRQINDLATRISELAIRSVEADDRLRDTIERNAEESRKADDALRQRIESLVSGIGAFMARKEKE